MTFQIEDIKSILKNYETLYEEILDVIDLHRAVDECYYEVTDITPLDSGLSVDVEFYKWQDINHSNIFIDYDLLTNPQAFEEFKAETEKKIEAKKEEAEQKVQKEKDKAIEAAMKLLKDNGIENL